MPTIGDNSIDDEKLRAHFDAIVSAENRKREAAEDVKEAYSVAKSDGFDVNALKLVVKAYLDTEEARRKAEGKHAVAHVYAQPLQIALPF